MIIVNKISKSGFRVGWVSALDDYGRTGWIIDAHRNGKCSVRAEEKLTAFVKLERRLIPKGEQFLLQMRTADDGRRFIVHSDPVSAST